MTATKEFHIELSCNHPRWWCYNAVMMCSLFDEKGKQQSVVSAASEVAAVGANLTSCPDGTDPTRKVVLDVGACHHIGLHAYIIPHTLPTESDIEDMELFKVDLRITARGKLLLSKQYDVNPWSGATIELKGVE